MSCKHCQSDDVWIPPLSTEIGRCGPEKWWPSAGTSERRLGFGWLPWPCMLRKMICSHQKCKHLQSICYLNVPNSKAGLNSMTNMAKAYTTLRPPGLGYQKPTEAIPKLVKESSESLSNYDVSARSHFHIVKDLGTNTGKQVSPDDTKLWYIGGYEQIYPAVQWRRSFDSAFQDGSLQDFWWAMQRFSPGNPLIQVWYVQIHCHPTMCWLKVDLASGCWNLCVPWKKLGQYLTEYLGTGVWPVDVPALDPSHILADQARKIFQHWS